MAEKISTYTAPDGTVSTHKSRTGEEPIYVKDDNTVMNKDKLQAGQQVRPQQLSYRLSELAREYYLFSLAPVYLLALLDRRTGGFKMDLLHRYGVEMRLRRLPNVVSYQSPMPIFHGDMGVWDHYLWGLPLNTEYDFEFLFAKWMEQLVLVNRDVKPVQYWRVNTEVVQVMTPGAFDTPASVTVFLPTGMDMRLSLQGNPDYTFSFVSGPPEQWVVDESIRYFNQTR
jgi:hypothetical protein